MFINKKIIGLAIAPSGAAIAAFSSASPNENYKIIVNYNGQADLLLSLQIPPDYYPYQFKKTTLYDYLTDVNKYIVVNNNTSTNKKQIKEKLQGKINELLGKVKEFGPSLWNEDLYDTGIVFRNDQFWNNKKTSLLFIEQFIADDYTDIRNSYDLLPVHKNLMVTNYRAARDPYTIFSEIVFKCFETNGNGSSGGSESQSEVKCEDKTGDQEIKDKELYEKFKSYMESYNQASINSIYRFGKFINFWNDLVTKNKEQLTKLGFFTWLKEDKLFSLISEQDKELAKKYMATIFNKAEKNIINGWQSNWQMNYERQLQKNSSQIKLKHHPALEQQILPGTAPLAEGSQKDIIIFLYQFAALIDKYSKDSSFETEFGSDYRKDAMQSALKNAGEMANNIKTRISNIRDYFKELGVVDNGFDPDKNTYTTTNSKTFTVITYPPSSFGAGEATIQSMSKFPFIYSDIGLKQPVPNNLINSSEAKLTHSDNEEDESLEHEIFSVDDNGWWWKIGNANLDPTNLLAFEGTSDTMLILANEDDWNLLNDEGSQTLRAISVVSNNEEVKKGINVKKINTPGYSVSYNKYHLWNEGLRSPIALNLLLDNLVDIFQKQYDSSFSKTSKYSAAMDWGKYWHDHFINGTNVQNGNSESQKK